MADSKVSLDEAFQRFTTTLNAHTESIQRIETNIISIQQQHDTQIPMLQNNTREELHSIADNLTTLFTSKDEFWSKVTDDMRMLKADLFELKDLIRAKAEVPRSHNAHSPSVQANAPDATSTPMPPLLHHNQMSSTFSTQPWGNPHPRTIVLPPTSAIPTFSGKPTERPRQFLLRIEEYTHTVNHWSRDTLLHGISQYLKDDALEWYCQLHALHMIPHNWEQFSARFLAQFHSPLRAAQQEQAWIDCKQAENETINQFVVRLRSLWLEQKTDEVESDFTKHLFCKMRPDMLNLMNFSRSSSLEAIIVEAQKVEEILFLRNKEQRQREFRTNKTTPSMNHYQLPTSATPTSSVHHSYTQPLMPPSNTYRTPTRNSQRTDPIPPRTTRNPITCWRCYDTGHYSTHCPLNEEKPPSAQTFSPPTHGSATATYQPRHEYNDQPLPPRRKNE